MLADRQAEGARLMIAKTTTGELMSIMNWDLPSKEIIRTVSPEQITGWLAQQCSARRFELTRAVRVKLDNYIRSYAYVTISGSDLTLADKVYELLEIATRMVRAWKPGSEAHLVWQALSGLVDMKRRMLSISIEMSATLHSSRFTSTVSCHLNRAAV